MLTHKPVKEYWTCRIAAAVCGVLFLASWVGFMYGSIVLRDNRDVVFAVPTMVLVAPVLVFGLSLAAFPWQYSPLGKLRRTGFPGEAAIEMFYGQWAKIGGLRISWLGANWFVFSAGLGLELSFGCKAFLPYSAMLGWEKRWVGYALHHNSPEMRSPLVMPICVYKSLKRVLSKQEREIPQARVV
jgi:hypothetical protein